MGSEALLSPAQDFRVQNRTRGQPLRWRDPGRHRSDSVLDCHPCFAARLAQVEMIRAGTTCFADPGSYFCEETARAVREAACAA
jgi:hypothetical protein